ncbi:MAG TPA: AI-2E family transporter [Ktedonobacterales bacterium]|jgi:predicted PurR-regulated permease PerM
MRPLNRPITPLAGAASGAAAESVSAGDAPRSSWAHRRDVALTVLIWIVVTAMVLWAAAHVVHALLVLVIAGLLAYALMPPIAYLSRWIPRPIAVVVIYLLVLAVVGAIGYAVINTAVVELTALAEHIRELLTPNQAGIAPLVAELEALGIPRAQIDAFAQQLAAQIQAGAQGALPLLSAFVTVTLSAMLDTVLVVVLSIYLLADGRRVAGWLRANAPTRYRPRVTLLLHIVERVVGGYIRGQVLLCALIGVLVGGGMAVLGVPYAVLLGVLAFILEFIPNLGTLVSGAICVLAALTQGWVLALVVLGYFVFVHVIEGYIVGPRIVGRAVGVHPAVSIVALLAGAELFGLWGALFASPVAGLAQAFLAAIWVQWRQTHLSEYDDMRSPPPQGALSGNGDATLASGVTVGVPGVAPGSAPGSARLSPGSLPAPDDPQLPDA